MAYFRNWSEEAPFHFRIARREVRADVAVGQRTEDGVDQCMQADIAVGMSRKALRMRHAHAADHDVVAFSKGMDVVARAGPDVAEQAGKARFLAHEILGVGELHVGSIAFKGCNRQSRPFSNRGIIGEIAAPVLRRATIAPPA